MTKNKGKVGEDRRKRQEERAALRRQNADGLIAGKGRKRLNVGRRSRGKGRAQSRGTRILKIVSEKKEGS